MSGKILCTDDAIAAVGNLVEWDVVARDGRKFGTFEGVIQEVCPGSIRITGMWCRLKDLPNLRIKTP